MPAESQRRAMHVRDATPADAAACAAIYAPYVRDTAISFEAEPPTVQEMQRRIADSQQAHAWLVLVDDDQTVAGYAYGHEWASRAAYRWTCEVSVYLGLDRHRSGGGRALYGVLLPRLAARGYRTAVAGMTLPNDASAGLHAAFGFEPVGVYRRVGYKLGAWRDVAWWQLSLVHGEDPPAEPT